MYKLNLDNGKYTIYEDLNNGIFKAERYREEWRDLAKEGDNLIYFLVMKIQELEEKNKKINNWRYNNVEVSNIFRFMHM